MTTRFKALNLDSSEESECDNDAPTKEALEEKATALYKEALQHQANDEWDSAERVYQQLLQSEVLSKVSGRVTFINGRIKPSMEHLKYCCYQNYAHVLVSKDQFEDGLELYKKALELDDTDLNLWYRIGLIGMKLADLDVAISAFEEALIISPRHFPSLDNLITATYAQGGLLNCLYYIARALEYNPKYQRALALMARIFKDHPSIKEQYMLFNPYPNYPLDMCDVLDVDATQAEAWYQDIVQLRAAQPRSKPSVPPSSTYTLPCRPTTLFQLGLLLSATYSQLMEEAPQMDLFRPVNLLSDRQFSDIDMEVGIETEQTIEDNEMEIINNEGGNDLEDVELMGGRSKRRRSSPTSIEEQWMTGKRRSTRVRNTARKEEPTLARTLTSLLPASLLGQSGDERKDNEVIRWNEDSMDTMDMYRLFENKDVGELHEMEFTNRLSDEERARLMKEENYFATENEFREVEEFLSEFTGSDIVILIEQLVMVLAKKWHLHWPSTLGDLYILIYKAYLQHHYPRLEVYPRLLKNIEEGEACILYGELLLDQWLRQTKHRNKPSPLDGSLFGGEFPSLLLGDLQDISNANNNLIFTSRYRWMRALLSLYSDNITSAVDQLSLIDNTEMLENVNVRLANVTNHFIINKNTVNGLLSTLIRKQMVDELADLYEQGDCEQIAAILSEVLKHSKRSGSLFQPSLDKESQYSLLLYTLWRLDKFKECMQWGEVSLHQSVTQLLAAVMDYTTIC